MKVRIRGLFFITTIALIIIYSIIRISFTIYYASQTRFFDISFSTLLLLSELFVLIQSIGYALHLFRSAKVIDYKQVQANKLSFPLPSVAILVAARHEPKNVLRSTFRSIYNLRYPNKKIYFLDDSSLEEFKQEAEEISKEYGLNLFRRAERHGAKAGIINDCLQTLTEKYVAIFDADQNPMQGFLTNTIPLLEQDPQVAFVQTPQFYYNSDVSPVAHAATYQQAVFYEYICESKGASNSIFCCGTNVVFNREALLSVGGFDESLITEDVATSLKLHKKGWKSIYYNHVGTFGMAPENLAEYFKQQARWSRGNFGLLRKIIKNLILSPFSLTLAQWVEYILSSTYYFIGFAFFILMLCPIVYMLFNVPSYFIHSDIYLSVFVPYFILSMGIFYTTLKARNYKMKDIFKGQMLSCITFPVYIKAALLGLLGVQGTFGITMKGSVGNVSYIYLWPQIVMIFLNFIALVWGVNRFYYEEDLSLIINGAWLLYHFLLMVSVLHFNKVRQEVVN